MEPVQPTPAPAPAPPPPEVEIKEGTETPPVAILESHEQVAMETAAAMGERQEKEGAREEEEGGEFVCLCSCEGLLHSDSLCLLHFCLIFKAKYPLFWHPWFFPTQESPPPPFKICMLYIHTYMYINILYQGGH